MKRSRRDPDLDRRRFLGHGCRLAAAAACLPLAAPLAGCTPDSRPRPQAEPEPLHVPLTSLPLDRRMRYMHGDWAVEITRSEDGVQVRSLRCTHQGCNVRWQEERQVYQCPCHDGQFDAEGRPVYGPPRRALPNLPFTLTETEVIVGG